MRRRDYFETFREEFEKFRAMVEAVSAMKQQERRAAALMKNFEFDILDQKPSVPGARYAHPGLLPAQQVGAQVSPPPHALSRTRSLSWIRFASSASSSAI